MGILFRGPIDRNRYARILLRWRWIILIVSLVAVLPVEDIIEGELLDARTWLVLFLFGSIVPFIAWLVLTMLAHNIVREGELEHNFKLYRHLTQLLAHDQEWDELTKFIVQFPGTFLPIDHTALYVKDYQHNQLKLVSQWNAHGTIMLSTASRPSSEICESCQPSMTLQIDQSLKGAAVLRPDGDRLANEFRLPLTCNNLLVGLLCLVCRPNQSLIPSQMEFLDAISSEIALALALSIAHPRQLARARAEGQLSERGHVADELHSSLAQQIGYLHLSLDHMAGDGRLAQSDLQAELDRMSRVAGEAYERIRNGLSIMRSWETADLTQAVVHYAQATACQANLLVDVTTSGEPSLITSLMCQQIFNLVQEGLNNIVKHAQARHARIELKWAADNLVVTLADDGIGFDPASIPLTDHYGISLMSKRTSDLHGRVNIDSVLGQGTTLSFWIPLQ